MAATDQEIMQRAKLYIDKLANGINPLTDEPLREDDIVNNVRISRCLFYVSGVLEKVTTRVGSLAFIIDTSQNHKIQIENQNVHMQKQRLSALF